MYVTAHAHNRLASRLPAQDVRAAVALLEDMQGEQGTIAYIIGALPHKAHAPDGSNGDLIVAVALDGSVETVYFRRSTQDVTAGFFGADKVRDLRAYPLYRTGGAK